jgi:hypothetical protein
VAAGSEFCVHHAKLLATVDPETMRNGKTPKPRARKESSLRLVSESPMEAAAVEATPLRRADPASTDCTDPANWVETHVHGPFNLENAATAGGYFLGDYEGMAAIGTSFEPFFAAPTATDPDNTYLAIITP